MDGLGGGVWDVEQLHVSLLIHNPNLGCWMFTWSMLAISCSFKPKHTFRNHPPWFQPQPITPPSGYSATLGLPTLELRDCCLVGAPVISEQNFWCLGGEKQVPTFERGKVGDLECHVNLSMCLYLELSIMNG